VSETRTIGAQHSPSYILEAINHITDQPVPRKWMCFFCVAIGTFIAYLDSSIVNIALPSLSRYFEADLSVIEWIVTSYLLMITGLVVIFGRAADIHGRKKLYIFGFVIFTISSALCGAAPNVWSLVAFRCLQGVGAASLLANGTAIVTEVFPQKERGRALGMMASVLAASAIIGPLLGGFLADNVGWRSIFYVNIPIGIAGVFLAVKELPTTTTRGTGERFDIGGAITLLGSLSCFLFLINTLSRSDWQITTVVGLAIGMMALTAAFFTIETRVKQPLLDLSLFRRRAFSAATASSYLSFWAMASVSFLLPFYLDRGLGLNRTRSGYIMAPIPIVLVIFAPLGGYLSDRLGARLISTTGAVINCFGLLCLSTLTTATTPLGVILRMLPFGIGMGLFQPPNNSAIMGAVPTSRLGIASGMISAIKNLGSMSGVAVTSLCFTVAQAAALKQMQTHGLEETLADQQSFVAAVSAMYLLSAGICSLAVVMSLVRGNKPRGEFEQDVAVEDPKANVAATP
jgi:EmrB/QacA subfamily drug resistance transporter